MADLTQGERRHVQAHKAEKSRTGHLAALFYFLSFSASHFLLLELYTHQPWETMAAWPVFWNLVFYALWAAISWGMWGRLGWALAAQGILAAFLGLANAYVLRFRSAPIMPWDIFSFGTAAKVAGGFSYALAPREQAVAAAFALLLALELLWLGRRPYVLRGRYRLAAALGGALGMAALCLALWTPSFIYKMRFYDKLFTPTVMSYKDGSALAFLMQCQYALVLPPADYDREAAGQAFAAYSARAGEAARGLQPGEKPNIIVIMNEAFSDLRLLGEVDARQNPLAFFDSWKSRPESVSGWLHVSVLGGNTANTEFEFLTGASMAYLPPGSVAYQQYLRRPMPSLPRAMAAAGYETVAAHPYYRDGWERDRVYPLLGFDRFLAIEDFRPSKKVRNYVSDESFVDKVIDLHEESVEKHKPLFFFGVTMQNHSGYQHPDFANFRPQVLYEGEEGPLSNYLSLLYLSDKALERLVQYFEERQEKVVLVFFGDHQPAAYVSAPIWKAGGSRYFAQLQEEGADPLYQVPYCIWANYPLGEGDKEAHTSANYLGGEALARAGLPIWDAALYLEEVREALPWISSQREEPREGGVSAEVGPSEAATAEGLSSEGPPAEADGEGVLPANDLWQAYRAMQYYWLFDFAQEGSP